MSVVPASMRAPGRSGSRSMRPAVSAVIQRICSGTREPGPFTWRSIEPRLTVSVQTELRSMVGAAALRRESPKVIPPTTSTAATASATLRFVFGCFLRGMSTTLPAGLSPICSFACIGGCFSEDRAIPQIRVLPGIQGDSPGFSLRPWDRRIPEPNTPGAPGCCSGAARAGAGPAAPRILAERCPRSLHGPRNRREPGAQPFPAPARDRVSDHARRDRRDGSRQRAPPEVINFLKCLPKEQYDSYEAALRDFAEAERRFGLSNFGSEGQSRENINHVDPTQHP